MSRNSIRINGRSDLFLKKHDNKNIKKYKSKYDRIIHSKWSVLLLLVVFIFCYLVFGSYLALALGSITASFSVDVLLLCFSYWYLHTKQNKFITTWGKESKLSLTKFTVIISLCAIAIYFVCQFAGATASMTLGDPNMKINAKAMRANPYLTVLMSMIFAPIAEELVFRGMIYNTLKNAYQPLTSLILQALVFAVMHGTWAQGVGTLLLGLFNGFIYEYSGKIRYAIYSHIGYNLFAIFFASVPWPGAIYSMSIMMPIYAVATCLMILAFIKMTKLPNKKPAPNDPLKQILGIK